MVLSPDSIRGWICLLLSACLWAPQLSADWEPYHARYAVYRNGKLAGKAIISFETDGEKVVIRSEGSGTHGLARFLRASDTELVEGRMSQGLFRPEQYTHHTRVAGIDDEWTAQFDWASNTVNIIKGKEVLPLDLGTGALDGLSLKLELRRRLRDKDPDMNFWLVDEERIKPQEYRVLDEMQLETSLGCLKTLPVERVRTGSTRYTKAWYAPGLAWVTVRLEHGKTDGNHMEMRITELQLDQRRIKPKPGCAAMQTSQIGSPGQEHPLPKK